MSRLFASCLLGSLVVGSVVAQPLSAQDLPTKPVVKITDVTVVDVIVRNKKFVARTDVTVDIAGRIVVEQIDVPIRVDGVEDPEGVCDILNLAIGPLDLNLLGLVVELDDCLDGPVTVDIQAIEGGGLLGDLLCDISTGLLDGAELRDILDTLSDEDLATVTEGLRDVLNGILDEVLNDGTDVTEVNAESHRNNRCDILALAIPEGLDLTLLGLNVTTSGICLELYAIERGREGGLLGNLLCELNELLDDSDDNENRIERVVRRLNRVLDREGL